MLPRCIIPRPFPPELHTVGMDEVGDKVKAIVYANTEYFKRTSDDIEQQIDQIEEKAVEVLMAETREQVQKRMEGKVEEDQIWHNLEVKTSIK